MQNCIPTLQFPNYWNFLSDMDKYQYNCLRMSISSQYAKNTRNKRVENFTELLEIIKRFCIRGNNEDWRRCLVCGVCWLNEGIAINTRQLRLLIFKCKSSINGSLHKMGFTVNLGRTEAANALTNVIPILKDNTNELRQWTVRQSGNTCFSPISPPTAPSIPQPQIQTTINIDQPRNMPLPVPVISNTMIPPKTFDLPEETDTFEPEQLPEPQIIDSYSNDIIANVYDIW